MVIRLALGATNPVLESIRPVAEGSRHVQIDNKRIRKFSRQFRGSEIKHWMASYRVDFSGLSNDEKLAFLFVFNSISFSYWGRPKWSVPLEGNMPQRGTLCMLASLRRAVDDGRLVLDPEYLATIRKEALGEILRGTTEIPLLDKRCAILRELGQMVATRWRGSFANLVSSASGDALSLLAIITDMFPTFNDFSSLDGGSIYFHKRAQLLISDIYHVFDGEGHGGLRRVDKLTACADYVLPMVLRYMGILVYSPDLAEKVDGGVQIPRDSREEIEIRANTILAVELIREELGYGLPAITSMDLNDYLWLTKQGIPENVKHHLTRTTAY